MLSAATGKSDRGMVMSEKAIETKHNRTHKWAFPVGLIIVLLAVVGLVFLVVLGVKGIGKAFDNSEKIEAYNKFLSPVVMSDPAPFDDVTKADKSQLVDITIWSILSDELTPQKYEYTDEGMVIPAEDVEKKFHEVFGADTEIAHRTIEGYGYTFTYDAAAKTYTIPLTGIVPIYTPRVVDISKKGSATILTVALLAGDEWAQAANGDMIAPEPDKYVKITLREDKEGNTYISALQSTDAPETVTTTAPLEITEEPTTEQTSASDTTVSESETASATEAEATEANG
jgi:hypothetical protein